MVSYLDDAGRLLREARGHLERLPRQASPQELIDAARLKMRLAAQFAQLAAIEKGLQPPTADADERRPFMNRGL